MLSNTGYLYKFELDLSFDEEQEFVVCSCGHYKLETVKQLRTSRLGRKDWLLIYIANGVGHFINKEIERERVLCKNKKGRESIKKIEIQNIEIQNLEKIETEKGEKRGEILNVKKGHIVIFRPGEVQNFYYLLKEKAEVYWIHFSGRECLKILEELGFGDKSFYHVGCHTLYERLFDSIIQELQLKKREFNRMCSAYTKELFVKMSRENYNLENPTEVYGDSVIQFVIEEMFRDYKQALPIYEYAQKYNMSICWFIRKFKACTGESPQQFLIKIRIHTACELLRSSSLQVAEIASLVGYENSLYFSRLFHKVIGMSPTKFREFNR